MRRGVTGGGQGFLGPTRVMALSPSLGARRALSQRWRATRSSDDRRADDGVVSEMPEEVTRAGLHLAEVIEQPDHAGAAEGQGEGTEDGMLTPRGERAGLGRADLGDEFLDSLRARRQS